MAKMRVHELAKELNISNNDINPCKKRNKREKSYVSSR